MIGDPSYFPDLVKKNGQVRHGIMVLYREEEFFVLSVVLTVFKNPSFDTQLCYVSLLFSMLCIFEIHWSACV